MTKVTSKDGAQISYERTGSGPVVVFVGGALQSKSDRLMGRLAPLMAKDFTVVSYDRRGRGESSNIEPYDIGREIEDLEALIKEAGGSAYVFGNSSGGNLALLAATKLPSITKAAIYEAPFIPDRQLSGAAEYISQLKKFVTENQPGRALRLFFKRIGMPSPMVIVMSLTPMWSKLKALAPTLVYDALIVGDGSIPIGLKALTIPTLVITGVSDQMKQGAQALVAVLPHGQHQVLDGQTHDVKPDVLSSALTEFFKQKQIL
jgi:pimeloyl-ACP methyl ester carboxylesterase